MATYKKRGAKKSVSKPEVQEQEMESTTAEVFESLDVGASKTEEFVARNQNIILSLIGTISVVVLGYLAYDAYVATPNKETAVSELNQAQYYFNLAVNGEQNAALYNVLLMGEMVSTVSSISLKITAEHLLQLCQVQHWYGLFKYCKAMRRPSTIWKTLVQMMYYYLPWLRVL